MKLGASIHESTMAGQTLSEKPEWVGRGLHTTKKWPIMEATVWGLRNHQQLLNPKKRTISIFPGQGPASSSVKI